MFGIAFDEQRFQRLKKYRDGSGARLAACPRLAEFRAQLFQNRRRAGHRGAASFQPLKLGEKIAARQRRQSLQIILNPVGLFMARVSAT